MKFRASIGGNVRWMCEVIERESRAGLDAILFPECAVTGYHCDFARLSPGDIRAGLAAIARTIRAARVPVLLGCPTAAGRRWHNSLLVFDARGRLQFSYAKIHLTERDQRFFKPGNRLGYFQIRGVPCAAIICHERRYPELVRIPVMMGAQVLFHPNAGLDTLAVSKTKRRGRDGIAVRAFENQIFYLFANSVGPQGCGLWSAGDSKIVAPDGTTLALANNRDEMVIRASLDLRQAGRKYAKEALEQPAFLRTYWRRILAACRRGSAS